MKHLLERKYRMNERIKNKLALLPDQPGCYLMKDKNGTIIYVGKSQNFEKPCPILFSW